jgi:hypothetical protein
MAAAAMEGIRHSEAKLTVYVHPSNADDVRRAVARQLNTLLFSYVPPSLPLSCSRQSIGPCLS